MECIEKPSVSEAIIKAQKLHEAIMQTYALGNRVRRKFLELLFQMSDEEHYEKLGFGSVVEYTQE